MANSKTLIERLNRQFRRIAQRSCEDRVYKMASLGTVAAGLLACLTSLGVGMTLILAGAMVFVEV